MNDKISEETNLLLQTVQNKLVTRLRDDRFVDTTIVVEIVNGGAFGDLNAVLTNIDFDVRIDLNRGAESAGLRGHGGRASESSETILIE